MQAIAMSLPPVKVGVTRYNNVYCIQDVLGGSSSLHEQALLSVKQPVRAHMQIWQSECSEAREACMYEFGLTCSLRCSQQQYAEWPHTMYMLPHSHQLHLGFSKLR